MKGTHKQTEASLKCLDNHRCLFQSEESKELAPSLLRAHIHLFFSDREKHL